MRKKYRVITAALAMACLAGCGNAAADGVKETNVGILAGKEGGAGTETIPEIKVPKAEGVSEYKQDGICIDTSNTSEGYIMVKYDGDNPKVKMQVDTPAGDTYTYVLSQEHVYETFPLTRGSGTYKVKIFENIEGDQYAMACVQDIEAEIADEFSPFLYPNQYVSFQEGSSAVEKGKELAEGKDDMETVSAIYEFVTSNIAYDEEKAETVSYGYLPDVDKVLEEKKGICFDYAALMTAMLRSQGIPAKLEVGYAGSAYHAWVSVYIQGEGWIDNMLQFDGEGWHIMDPTFAANIGTEGAEEYIGDGEHYELKYSY